MTFQGAYNEAFQQVDTELIAPPKILVDVTEVKEGKKGIKVANALLIVMRLSGVRKGTVKEYIYTFNRLVEAMEIEFLNEITLEMIFNWLSKLRDFSDVSKQNHLRIIKAVLNRFYDNGWLEKNFWKDIRIRVDTKITDTLGAKWLQL